VNFISEGWDRPLWYPVGGFGNREADTTYPGGNDAHHVTGAAGLITSSVLPVNLATAQPIAGSALLNAGILNSQFVAPQHLVGLEFDPVTMVAKPRPVNTLTIGARE
jgi:hypothetical protein